MRSGPHQPNLNAASSTAIVSNRCYKNQTKSQNSSASEVALATCRKGDCPFPSNDFSTADRYCPEGFTPLFNAISDSVRRSALHTSGLIYVCNTNRRTVQFDTGKLGIMGVF